METANLPRPECRAQYVAVIVSVKIIHRQPFRTPTTPVALNTATGSYCCLVKLRERERGEREREREREGERETDWLTELYYASVKA